LAVAVATPDLIKNVLQLVASGNYYSNAHHAKLKKQPEIVQVTVVKLRLVVPFNFNSNFVFEAVNRMRWAIADVIVNFDLGGELLLEPSKTVPPPALAVP